MVFKSLFTKGVALAQSGKCRNYSAKASSSAKKASNYFRSAKSKKGIDATRRASRKFSQKNKKN